MTRASILVLDGHTNQALACVRSLGRAGHEVLVASHWPRPLAAWSRFAQRRLPLDDETRQGFAALRARAAAAGVTHVLPLTERSCFLCSLDRADWTAAGIVVACGPHDVLLRAFDKAQTLQYARTCGLRVPDTLMPESLDACRAAAHTLEFPCVVKPRFSNAWDGARFLPDPGVAYAASPPDLDQAVLDRRQGPYWPLLQRLVPGRGIGVFALCDRGVPVAWFAHERLRDVRPTGSGSSLRRAVPLAPALRQPVERLLRALAWHGPVMVELRDDGLHPPALIEVNGRFWGSLQLAVSAGADFPRWWLNLLLGEPLPAARAYTPGVTLRWLWGDVKRFGSVLQGPPRGHLGPYPTRRDGLRELLGRQPPGTRSETWQRDDSWPALGEWVQGVSELARRTWARAQGVVTSPPLGEDTATTAPTAPLRVLTVTCAWPTPGQPRTTHFIKRQVEFLRSAGVAVDVFHFTGRRNPWRYAWAWFRLQARIAGGHYDLIHAQFGQSGLLAFPKRLPLVVTFRGSDLLGIVGNAGQHTLPGRLLQALSRWVAQRADAVIVVSDHMKQYLPPSVSAAVIPSGLDLELLRPISRDEARRQLTLPSDRCLVLFAGNPAVARKRFALAQAAVALLSRTVPSELIVAWDVRHADMPLYMSACDALVFTSMQEGSPNVVKEALACNLPVVSVPIGDVPQRLRGIEGCELCPDERPGTIAAALARVLRRGHRINGRTAVLHLDERALTQEVIGIYRRLADRAARHAGIDPAVSEVSHVSG